MNTTVELETSVVVDGRTWRLFGIEYTTADGVFTTYIHALSFEHAAALLHELRDTAKLIGEIHGVAGVK